eukprot:CAMPEP_0181290074 /NCGR_PEP_ID=MMETSP1101-20121128/1224_1 /TAXON_ID=46948 /ORGANISM="Rhodomonas abbreviata, Strain Caron Lab Isolate" /LENGTH=1392 /DNA_ID=CAMNT_0023394343 /DNA_START=102 /DNA_END=4280 /DNA_ORIENTATION=-
MPPIKLESHRHRPVIKPGRVVPGSSTPRRQEKVSALVEWGLRRASAKGSSYVRSSYQSYTSKLPPEASGESSMQHWDYVLGNFWPGTLAEQEPQAQRYCHETPMLLHSKPKDKVRVISLSAVEKRAYLSCSREVSREGSRASSREGSREVSPRDSIIASSPLETQTDSGKGGGEEGQARKESRKPMSPISLELEVCDEGVSRSQQTTPTSPAAARQKPFSPPQSTLTSPTSVLSTPTAHLRHGPPLLSKMSTYHLNSSIPQPLASDEETAQKISQLKAELEAEQRLRKDREREYNQLLDLFTTLESISEKLNIVNKNLEKVKIRVNKSPYASSRGKVSKAHYPPPSPMDKSAVNKLMVAPDGDGPGGLLQHGPSPTLNHADSDGSITTVAGSVPPTASSDDASDKGVKFNRRKSSVVSMLSTDDEDIGLVSQSNAPSDEEDTGLPPKHDGPGSAPASLRPSKPRDGPSRPRKRSVGRLTHGRSWRGKWGKVRESFDVWKDFQQNAEAEPSESVDLLRTALLRHGCGMERVKLQRLLNDMNLVAGSHMEYGDYLQVVRQAFAQRKMEHWLRSLKMEELVEGAIHDCLEMEEVAPQGVFSISEDQSKILFSEVEKRLLTKVKDLNLQAKESLAKAHKPGDGNSKFALNAVTGNFGELKTFFDGLDKHIGLPNPRILRAMEVEHNHSEDSDDFFVTTNYNGTRTKPSIEWEFALNPDPNVEYPGVGDGESGRVAAPLKSFLDHPFKERAELTDAEVLALRLYTGPMFMKYNTCLRKFPEDVYKACKGNGYVTTIHAIVSGIIKLSKVWVLPEERKLFRGLGGMLLPQVFWVPDEFGCRGGVELGLLSMTTNREIALQYSGKSDFRPTVFEIDVGQVDRGASVNWLSQYPKEEEVLMPPLSNLEVVGAPRMELVDGEEVMIVPLRVNVNIKSLTMDELIGRRMTLHMAMSRTIREETLLELKDELQTMRATVFSGAYDKNVYQQDVDDIIADFDHLIEDHDTKPPDWFNEDEHYRSAIVEVVGMKRLALLKWNLIVEHRKAKMNTSYTGDNSWAMVGEALLQRIQETRCQEFANEGVIYRLRSGYDDFPWEEVIDRKISEVEIPSNMEADQVILAWKCLERSKEVVQKVTIQGAGYYKLFQKSLDFSNRRPQMQSRGVGIVVGLFQVNTTVEELKMNHCIVQDDGAKTLALGLPFIPELRRLELSSADIGMPGMKQLCTVFTRLTKLEVLLLHDNHIGDQGVTGLSKGLKGMTQLTQLDLSKNEVRLRGAQELAWSIGRLSKLSGLSLLHLNVSDNPIEEDGAVQIAHSVKYLTALHTLNLNKTFNYTMEAGKQIRDIVPPTCKIYGIGEHALAEHELISTSTNLAFLRNSRPKPNDLFAPVGVNINSQKRYSAHT